MSSPGKVGAPTEMDISIPFDDKTEAENIYRALKVDDDEYVETMLEDNTVRGHVKADSVEGARRAADDWLACLMAIVNREE